MNDLTEVHPAGCLISLKSRKHNKLYIKLILPDDEYHEMLNITCSLEERIYSNIDDISKKGVDSMLNEKIVLWDDRIMAEAKAEAKAEEKRELAKMMINDRKPIDEIEKYTGLNAAALKSIAQSIGKTLVI